MTLDYTTSNDSINNINTAQFCLLFFFILLLCFVSCVLVVFFLLFNSKKKTFQISFCRQQKQLMDVGKLARSSDSRMDRSIFQILIRFPLYINFKVRLKCQREICAPKIERWNVRTAPGHPPHHLPPTHPHTLTYPYMQHARISIQFHKWFHPKYSPNLDFRASAQICKRFSPAMTQRSDIHTHWTVELFLNVLRLKLNRFWMSCCTIYIGKEINSLLHTSAIHLCCSDSLDRRHKRLYDYAYYMLTNRIFGMLRNNNNSTAKRSIRNRALIVTIFHCEYFNFAVIIRIELRDICVQCVCVFVLFSASAASHKK